MHNDGSGGTPWRAIAAFLVLVFPLSWYSWLLGFADDPGNSGINPLGVLAAALLVAAAGGWKGFTGWLRGILRVRASWRVYATALLLPAALAAASVAVAVALGSEFPAGEALARWKEVPDAFLFILLFVALGEEPGWRGWLLPRLQERMTPLKAALAVAPVWALWHLPLFGEEFAPGQILPFLISLTAASVVLAWLTNRTEGGVLPAMLCHAMVNAIGSAFLFSFFSGPEKTMLWWIHASMWGTAALAFVVLTRGRLGLKVAGSPAFSEPESGPSAAPDDVAASAA